MEGAPIADNPEQAPPPDLLAAFADRVVTAYGMTGTFQDLAGICPVDLSDPGISTQAKNEFVVKVANEAGLEIEPEYEAIFTQVTEKHGLKTKFTVIEPSKTAIVGQNLIPPTKLPGPKNKTFNAPAAALRSRPARRLKPEIGVAGEAEHIVRLEQRRLDQEVADAQDAAPQTGRVIGVIKELPRSIGTENIISRYVSTETAKPDTGGHPPPKSTISAERPQAMAVADSFRMPEVSASTAATLSVIERTVPLNEVTRIPAVTVDKTGSIVRAEAQSGLADNGEDVMSLREIPITYLAEQAAEAPAIAYEADEAAADAWAAELTRQPLEIYEDFTAALQLLAVEVDMEPADGKFAEELPVPPIVTTVAGRLGELTIQEKEAVAPVMQEIVGVIYGIQLLKSQEATLEVVTTAEAQLEELCVSLFKAIGVEYDEGDLERFIWTVSSPEFQPLQLESPALPDLEYAGTREAKRHFPKLTGGLAGVEEQLRHVLGMVALSHLRARQAPA